MYYNPEPSCMTSIEAPVDLSKFEWIDWDPEEDEQGNLAHCRRLGLPEQVVYEVLSEEPVEIELPVDTAEGAFVGPNRARNQLWTLLFDTSYKRGLVATGHGLEGQAGGDSRMGAGHLEEMEGTQMNDEARRSEQERRELAQQHAGEVVEGSGRVVAPRRLGQMVSVRLEPGLAAALRKLASQRGISVSEALREATVRLLEDEQATPNTSFSWRIVSVPTIPTSTTDSGNVSAAR
jgi:Ribbon-helix-helix protein, copG family